MSKKIVAGIVVSLSLILVCLIVINITKDEPQERKISNSPSESKEFTRLITEMKDNLKDYKEIREIKLQNDKVVIATTIDSADVENAATFSDQIMGKLTQFNQQDVVGISCFVEINDKAGIVISGMQFQNK